MLVEYRNKIYRRKERLSLSFCDKCPLSNFDQDPCYIGKIPHICPVTGTITSDISKIFDL